MESSQAFHLVIFSDTFYETNGIGSYYRTLLNWCSRTGKQAVTLVCPDRPDLDSWPEDERVRPLRANLSFRNPFYRDLMLGYYSRRRLSGIMEAIEGPKVAHIASSGSLGVAGAVAARRLKVPAIGCYHTVLQDYCRLYGRGLLGRPGEWLGGKAGVWCDRRAYGQCEAICSPSETAVESIRNFYRGRVEIVPNPIDMERFQPAPTREGAFRERYGHADRTLAVVVGRVAKEKNLDLVCELLGSDDRIDLVFVGDGPYATSLRERWNATVTGFLHGPELMAAYQQADVFVQLSVTETFGLSLVEAMACGLPVVALRSPGFADRIPPGHGVEILENGDLPNLADRCVDLTSNRERQAEASRLVREFVRQISADAVLPEMMDLHRQYAR